jgi:tetratricopeptide (TPR) repeat protein
MSGLDIFLLILMAVGFLGILFVIIRKFPEIASINVETLKSDKSEKERLEKIKEEMFIKRLVEARVRLAKFLMRVFSPIGGGVIEFFKSLGSKFKETERKYKKAAENLSKEETVVKIKNLITEAGNFVRNASYDMAEKYYLEALSLDFKNIDVYDGLAWLYVERKQYKEAREALEFILKLNPNYSDAYYGLAEIAKREERIDEAVEFAKKAVELSSSNPKYLDFLIEMCIMAGRADLAKSALEQLKLVNPENNKIGDFEARIKELKK